MEHGILMWLEGLLGAERAQMFMANVGVSAVLSTLLVQQFKTHVLVPLRRAGPDPKWWAPLLWVLSIGCGVLCSLIFLPSELWSGVIGGACAPGVFKWFFNRPSKT